MLIKPLLTAIGLSVVFYLLICFQTTVNFLWPIGIAAVSTFGIAIYKAKEQKKVEKNSTKKIKEATRCGLVN